MSTRSAIWSEACAEPLLGQNGEVLDGGADISFASIASYYQDVIYLCSFVQVFCIYSDKAFWAFWLLPLVAGWIVYSSLIKPLIAHSAATRVWPFSNNAASIVHDIFLFKFKYIFRAYRQTYWSPLRGRCIHLAIGIDCIAMPDHSTLFVYDTYASVVPRKLQLLPESLSWEVKKPSPAIAAVEWWRGFGKVWFWRPMEIALICNGIIWTRRADQVIIGLHGTFVHLKSKISEGTNAHK